MPEHQIGVDLELHKLIESHRRSLEETRQAIVKRVLQSGGAVAVGSDVAEGRGSERLSRTRGNYEFKLFGAPYKEGSLKRVLSTVLSEIERRQPGFLEKLATHRTTRGRRIVARTPNEIYPLRPQLADKAEKLDGRWWFDTNVSRAGTKRYLEAICKAAGLTYKRDLEVSF